MRDPYLLLGIAEDADDAAVEAAYLAAIKACPPERDAAHFQALRHAYEQLRTRRDRVAHALFDRTPPGPADLLDRAAPVGEPRRPDRGLVNSLLRGEE